MYVAISKLVIVLQIKSHWIYSTVKNKKKSVSFSITFSSTNFSNFFPCLVSAGTGTTYRMFTKSTQISSLFLGSWKIEPIDRVPACS